MSGGGGHGHGGEMMQEVVEFGKSRVNAALNGMKDVFNAQFQLVSETVGWKDSEPTPGLIKLIKNAGVNVKDMFRGSGRGIFDAYHGYILSAPFDFARRAVAGVNEVVGDLGGNIIGLLNAPLGNWARRTYKGGMRAATGIVLGDKGYQDLAETKYSSQIDLYQRTGSSGGESHASHDEHHGAAH